MTSRRFNLVVRGNSMATTDAEARWSFEDGDVVTVDPDRPPAHLSFVVARETPGAPLYLRQLVVEGGARKLVTLNPAHPEAELGPQAEILGVVVFAGRVPGGAGATRTGEAAGRSTAHLLH